MPLVPRTRGEVLATLDHLSPDVRAQMSPKWFAMLEASVAQDPWVHGFNVVDGEGRAVGLGSFKGPPIEGIVEIAYAIEPAQQGKGFATVAARDLTEYAFTSGLVRVVCAHTLPDGHASQRVLLKAGFVEVGEADNPEDGRVWRYERIRS